MSGAAAKAAPLARTLLPGCSPPVVRRVGTARIIWGQPEEGNALRWGNNSARGAQGAEGEPARLGK